MTTLKRIQTKSIYQFMIYRFSSIDQNPLSLLKIHNSDPYILSNKAIYIYIYPITPEDLGNEK